MFEIPRSYLPRLSTFCLASSRSPLISRQLSSTTMRENRWNCDLPLITSTEETLKRIRVIASAICETEKDVESSKKALSIANYFPVSFWRSVSQIIKAGIEQSRLCPTIIRLNTVRVSLPQTEMSGNCFE